MKWVKCLTFCIAQIAIIVGVMIAINQVWTGDWFLAFDMLASMAWGAFWAFWAVDRWIIR